MSGSAGLCQDYSSRLSFQLSTFNLCDTHRRDLSHKVKACVKVNFEYDTYMHMRAINSQRLPRNAYNNNNNAREIQYIFCVVCSTHRTRVEMACLYMYKLSDLNAPIFSSNPSHLLCVTNLLASIAAPNRIARLYIYGAAIHSNYLRNTNKISDILKSDYNFMKRPSFNELLYFTYRIVTQRHIEYAILQ